MHIFTRTIIMHEVKAGAIEWSGKKRKEGHV
jgi:hypothetical protein